MNLLKFANEPQLNRIKHSIEKEYKAAIISYKLYDTTGMNHLSEQDLEQLIKKRIQTSYKVSQSIAQYFELSGKDFSLKDKDLPECAIQFRESNSKVLDLVFAEQVYRKYLPPTKTTPN